MTSAATRLSLDEFLALPEEKPYREYLRGEVTEKAMPTDVHGVLAAEISFALAGYLKKTREGRVRIETRFADRGQEWVYLPDVCVRLGLAAPQQRRAVEGAPEFAIEVLSPEDRLSRTMERVELYMAAGTRLLWVVDGERRTITAYRPEQPVRTYHTGDTADGQPVLEGFTLDVAALFASLDEDNGE